MAVTLEFVNCVQVYLNRVPNDRNRLLVPCTLDPPNPKCYVCAPKPEVTVVLNCSRFKVGALQDKVSVCVCVCMCVCVCVCVCVSVCKHRWNECQM